MKMFKQQEGAAFSSEDISTFISSTTWKIDYNTDTLLLTCYGFDLSFGKTNWSDRLGVSRIRPGLWGVICKPRGVYVRNSGVVWPGSQVPDHSTRWGAFEFSKIVRSDIRCCVTDDAAGRVERIMPRWCQLRWRWYLNWLALLLQLSEKNLKRQITLRRKSYLTANCFTVKGFFSPFCLQFDILFPSTDLTILLRSHSYFIME